MSFITSLLKIFVGDKSKKDVQALQPVLAQIQSFEEPLKALNHDQLRQKTASFIAQIQEDCKAVTAKIEALQHQAQQSTDIDRNEATYAEIDKLNEQAYTLSQNTLNTLLPEAFAVVKETARRFAADPTLTVTATAFDRTLSASKTYVTLQGDQAIWTHTWDAAGKQVTWDMVHYDVQLIGGIALHRGKIAEMQTGEGKTLVATLPLYLNALAGKGAHLVTVNDYLAKRDSAWMAPLFEFHGLSVACIDNHLPNSEGRRAAYQAHITYGTNNEFGFDYLRDNMAHTPQDIVQRPHHYTIVDEVDSVLIDDARTPLIISGPVPEGDRHEFNELRPKLAQLVQQQRQYLTGVLAEAKKRIKEGDTKEGGLLLLRVHRGLPKNKAFIKFLSEEGVKRLLQKTEHFYMQDNNREMHQVDAELLFVINEKNNQIELTEKGVDYLSEGKDKDFFVLPDMGSQIAKIEQQQLNIEKEAERKEALFKDFAVKSERIHTLTQLLKAYTLFEKDVQYVVMNNKVMIVDEQTGRIMQGRRYSDGLHQAIEAKENVKIEAMTQTFATVTLQNYFRMYKKLAGMTGTALTEAGEFWEIYNLDVMEIPTHKPIARHDRHDLIYKTRREKYNAIIDEVIQLSRAKRPVLIGTTSVDISELLSKLLDVRKIPHNVLNAKRHKKEADIVAEAGKPGVVTIATNMAGRGTDIKLTEEVKQAGGLAIIGTERHDSRRVDRQLRGRSGRQGDPGSSQFYVSLEDNLMRLFGSERIAKLMDRMGLKEGEVIQHSMMTRSIERAQKKVEENNFGIRKRLLEYDNVMNAQREVIYKQRRHALQGERLQVDLANMIYDTCESITEANKIGDDYKNFEFELIKYLALPAPLTEAAFKKEIPRDIAHHLYKVAYESYRQKMERSAATALPVIKKVYEDPANTFQRIVVPFTDGLKTLKIVTNLQAAYTTHGKQLITDFEKNVTLAIIDEAWKTHLRKMDELKQSVQLAVHEQKDPLLIYKFEAFELFRAMIDQVNKDIISFLFKAALPAENPNPIQEAVAPRKPKQQLQTTKEAILNNDELVAQRRVASQTQRGRRTITETIVREKPKIGRNERVTVKNILSGESKTLKYKQAEPLLHKGEWVLVDEKS